MKHKKTTLMSQRKDVLFKSV